jgi:hypothetical protein
MRRHAEVVIAGRLAQYAAMAGKPPARMTIAVVAMVAATREPPAAARSAAVRDHFAVRINRGVVWKGRSVVPELVCSFSVT